MVSLRGSKFGSRVAMLCCNPSHATRPGPGAGIQVNRFNNYAEDRFQVAGHHTGRFHRGNHWNSSYAPFRWSNAPVANKATFSQFEVLDTSDAEFIEMLRIIAWLIKRPAWSLSETYALFSRSNARPTSALIEFGTTMTRKRRIWLLHLATHPCFSMFIPLVNSLEWPLRSFYQAMSQPVWRKMKNILWE